MEDNKMFEYQQNDIVRLVDPKFEESVLER
jgi:hypothetical protein